jgi:hypothetical protein
MKTLHLTLTKKWFDMILSGEKREEYREMKPYWKNRFCNSFGSLGCLGDCMCCEERTHGCTRTDFPWFDIFDAVKFRNGYAKNAPEMLVEVKGFSRGIGHPAWGAPSHPVFIIELGKILETKNIKL